MTFITFLNKLTFSKKKKNEICCKRGTGLIFQYSFMNTETYKEHIFSACIFLSMKR